MRTWIKILVILAIIIGFDIVTSSFLNNEHDFYDGKLTDLALFVENDETDKAQKIVDEVYLHWAKSHNLWEMLTDHAEVEQIDILFTKLYKYFPGDNKDDTLSDIMELYRMIEFTTRRYKVNIVNLL